MEISIIYQNDDYLICVKPSGLISEEGNGSLPSLLKEQTGSAVYPVHRLDRGTGGLMVYAKNQKFAAVLSELIRGGGLGKEYLTVLRGVPDENGVLTDLLYHDRRVNKSYVVKKSRAGVKEASLDYQLLDNVEYRGLDLSLVRVRLHTGRTHQIRVQFSSRRLPLYGDGKYGGRTEAEGIALWSYRLSFPYKGKLQEYCAFPQGFPWSMFAFFEK